MRVLVTGASGFIGRHVVDAIRRDTDAEIIAVSRNPLPEQIGVVRVEADLLAPNASAELIGEVRPSHLVHLAWEARPGYFWSAPENLDWCAASVTLLRTFAQAGGKRAVFAGSCAEYTWAESLLDEALTPKRPATLYGLSKDALRRLALGWAERTGLSVAWGRVFWLYGPGEPSGRLVSDVIDALVQGRTAKCSTGLQERDFMHVSDVAAGFVSALWSDYRGAFNLGSGQAVAVREVVRRIGEMTGREDLLDFGGRPTNPDEPPRLVAATQVMAKQIGFTPRYDLDGGLAETLAWRAHHKT